MPNDVELDCKGQKCPRPIIEMFKAARRSSPGAILSVRADDLAFESDVNAWIERAQATLLSLERDGDAIHVRIKLAG